MGTRAYIVTLHPHHCHHHHHSTTLVAPLRLTRSRLLVFPLLCVTFDIRIHPARSQPRTPYPLHTPIHPQQQPCLDEERAARDSEREVPSVTARSCATTSRVSQSPLSAVSLAVVVSSVSLA